MTTGSLDYPFAPTSTRPRWRPRQPWRASCDLDMTGVRQIGELAVDRESIERVLSDRPQSLQTILDALMDALRQETSSLYKAVESEEEEELLAIPSRFRVANKVTKSRKRTTQVLPECASARLPSRCL